MYIKYFFVTTISPTHWYKINITSVTSSCFLQSKSFTHVCEIRYKTFDWCIVRLKFQCTCLKFIGEKYFFFCRQLYRQPAGTADEENAMKIFYFEKACTYLLTQITFFLTLTCIQVQNIRKPGLEGYENYFKRYLSFCSEGGAGGGSGGQGTHPSPSRPPGLVWHGKDGKGGGCGRYCLLMLMEDCLVQFSCTH